MQNNVSDKENNQPLKSSAKKVNVFIITGFLGSGKTTVLNSLLQQFGTQKNFIIENEVGQINIDKDLVSGNMERIIEMTNGCLCCSMDGDLYDALDDISRLESLPDNLFIETTGIADAGNLSAIFREDFVMELFDLRKIICMVDVEVIEDYLQKTAEAGRQIVASDLVGLNKSSQLSNERVENIKAMILQINPFADVVFSSDGYISKDNLFSDHKWRPSFSLDFNTSKTFEHEINSVLFETDNRFSLDKLQALLQSTLYIYYQDVYRIKGYVRDERGRILLVQSAGKTLTIQPVIKEIDRSYLVFIGRKLTNEIANRLLRPAIIA